TGRSGSTPRTRAPGVRSSRRVGACVGASVISLILREHLARCLPRGVWGGTLGNEAKAVEPPAHRARADIENRREGVCGSGLFPIRSDGGLRHQQLGGKDVCL